MDAAWAQDWTDAGLRRRFGADVVERGRAYQRQGRVGTLSIGGSETGVIITAGVRGSQYRRYQTLVTQFGRGEGATVATTCSCPWGTDCKHAVAVLLAARAEVGGEGQPDLLTADHPGTGAAPGWERALRAVTEEVSGAALGTPLALQITSSEHRVLLRPLMRGASGRWIRTGVSWDEFAGLDAGTFPAAQWEAMARLQSSLARESAGYSFYYRRETDLSVDEASPSIWPALRAVRDAGVEFVSAAGTPPTRLAEDPARLVVELDPDGDGLTLHTRFVVPGARRGSAVRILGRPGHGVAASSQGELILAGLERPLSAAQQALLGLRGPLPVPAQDVPGFVAGYLPALRRVAEVRPADGLDLPTVAPPVVVLQVKFQPEHRASVHWSVRYEVGEGRVALDPVPQAGDPPVRDPDAERSLFASLPEGPWPTVDVLGQRRPARDAILAGRATIALASESLPALRALDQVEVEVVGEVPVYREADEAPQVRLSVREPDDPSTTDWFNLAVEVTLGGEKVPFVELFRALAQDEDHLILDSGTWFPLDQPELKQLQQLIAEAHDLDETEPGEYRLRAEQAGWWGDLVSLGVVAEQADSWRRSVSGLLDVRDLPSVAVPQGLAATLRPYQEDGFRWLSFLWSSRLGGVLADDMGLGKTLQTLAFVASAHERGELDHPVLVVAPTSVLSTWASEAARFAPGLSVRVVSQTAAKRGVPLAEVVDGANLVVTSYTLLRLDDDEYAAQPWSAVVLDEAQFVKNRQSKAYRAVRRLQARARLALTGTPLENNLMDLWSLLSITCPGLFPNPERFAELYRRPIEGRTDAEALPRLRRRIRPVMLRRTKEAVASELPPKQEQVIPVVLSPAHRRLYDRQLQAERKKVLGLVGDLTRNRIAILRSLTVLRQLSLAPSLVDPRNPAHSAKLDTLVEMMSAVAAEGHRALVFSQFTSFLALARARLDAAGLTYQYLDGRTRDRQARIDAFKEGDDPVFLISLKAGGFGLTLTEADYVFVLDPWWNPAVEAQAIDRTHRIGQDKNVVVYRLVSEDTIEEKVVALQERKRDLFAQVVGAEADFAAPLSAEDIRGLLDL